MLLGSAMLVCICKRRVATAEPAPAFSQAEKALFEAITASGKHMPGLDTEGAAMAAMDVRPTMAEPR